MKSSVKSVAAVLFSVVMIGGIAAVYSLRCAGRGRSEASAAVEKTWQGYKRYFIADDGRVMRVKDADTVSEGQAYAMLRAVWMGDKATFDTCYRWTETHLSRRGAEGDGLLSWHWKDGAVVDRMPASDADIDYALSLILAGRLWPQGAPAGLKDYGVRAAEMLEDILTHLTYRTQSGRLYLSPWIVAEARAGGLVPVNPSYYSPGHFRVFFEVSNDRRWLELADTTYFILKSLSRQFDKQAGAGLIPDWCGVDDNDTFHPLEGKSADFGYESVRVPLRVAMDWYWFRSAQAKDFFKSGFNGFIKSEWAGQRKIFCEYRYDGQAPKAYESPLFYAAYASALSVEDAPEARELMRKNRSFIQRKEGGWVYNDADDYYVNSLAWYADGFDAKAIRLIPREGRRR